MRGTPNTTTDKAPLMTPTETLKLEHQIILLVLEGVTTEAERIRRTGKVDRGKVAKMVDFFRNFVDRCRHAKEDNVLYPLADEEFGAEDERALTEAFDRVEEEEIGAGVHEKYHRLAHDLSES